jgi:hypothetical protein
VGKGYGWRLGFIASWGCSLPVKDAQLAGAPGAKRRQVDLIRSGGLGRRGKLAFDQTAFLKSGTSGQLKGEPARLYSSTIPLMAGRAELNWPSLTWVSVPPKKS